MSPKKRYEWQTSREKMLSISVQEENANSGHRETLLHTP